MTNDRWTTCGKGHQHWGAEGAAGLLLRHTDAEGTVRYMLQLRSPHVHHGGTWGIPGGAMQPGETPIQAAMRETREETGCDLPPLTLDRMEVDDHGGWAYHTVIADVTRRVTTGETTEQQRTGWFTAEEMSRLPLHQGLAMRLAWIIPTKRTNLDSAPSVDESPRC